jgi:hypothetical protein
VTSCSRIVAFAAATVVLAFGLAATHAVLHEFEPPGSGSALHGLACDDAHASPSCAVCFGKAPSRSAHRGPAPGGPEPTCPTLRHLHTPGTDPAYASRPARPESARAPPLSS